MRSTNSRMSSPPVEPAPAVGRRPAAQLAVGLGGPLGGRAVPLRVADLLQPHLDVLGPAERREHRRGRLAGPQQRRDEDLVELPVRSSPWPAPRPGGRPSSVSGGSTTLSPSRTHSGWPWRISSSSTRPGYVYGSPRERRGIPTRWVAFEYRYHNGEAWTADVASGRPRYVDPLTGPPGLRPPALRRAVGGRPAQHPAAAGNGIALAGMVCGIVGVVIGWLPFFGVLGIDRRDRRPGAVDPGLGRSRTTGERRGFAITGIVTSALGIVARRRSASSSPSSCSEPSSGSSRPGPNDGGRIESCTVEDGYLVARGAARRTDSTGDADYTVLVELDVGDRRRVEVDDVPAGETVTFVARSERPTSRRRRPTAARATSSTSTARCRSASIPTCSTETAPVGSAAGGAGGRRAASRPRRGGRTCRRPATSSSW